MGLLEILKKSSFNSQSGVKITPKMGLFLLLAWVVITLFGVALTLKVEKNFRYRITPFWGSFLINCSIRGVIFTPEKEFFKLLFEIKITPPKNNSAVRS